MAGIPLFLLQLSHSFSAVDTARPRNQRGLRFYKPHASSG